MCSDFRGKVFHQIKEQFDANVEINSISAWIFEEKRRWIVLLTTYKGDISKYTG
jgi:hypothetical protein